MILTVVVTLFLAAAIGFALPRWQTIVALAIPWPLYILGVKLAWWGNGLGDGWYAVLALLVIASVIGGAAGIAFRRASNPATG